MKSSFFVVLLLALFCSRIVSADENIGPLATFGESVFQIFPEGSDEAIGVATLVHEDGYFVTTQHATIWRPDAWYRLRRPSSPINGGNVEFRAQRISQPPGNFGFVSLLKAENWPTILSPKSPELCLAFRKDDRFTGSYIMYALDTGERGVRSFEYIGERFKAVDGTQEHT